MMFFLSLESTPAPPRGKAYRGSSLPSSHLQAKGSERSFTAERREPERKSRRKRRYVGTPDSSSGPCVLNLAIEPKLELLTTHFWAAAKVMHRWLRGANGGLSSPSVHNFGRAIRRWRASLTFSPATSAVAATKALPSSRSLTMPLPIACVYLFMFLCCPYLFVLFNDDLSASAARDASGKSATFKTEFLPPNGLGAVSLAMGSGIHRPSTTRQYS